MRSLLLFVTAAALGLGLGESAWGLALQAPAHLWPEWPRPLFWFAGAFTGLAFASLQALAWNSAFSLPLARGLRLATLSLLPCLLGWAWPRAASVHLPAPHDLPQRALQILMAAQAILSLGLSLALGIRACLSQGLFELLQPRSLALRLAALALLTYVLSGLWVSQWNMVGDAPHYTLMSHSLWFDQDVDLKDDYQHRDWRLFYELERELEPQVPDQADGRQMPEHKVGLSLLVLPGYVTLGIGGLLWTLGCLAALGGALLFLLALKLGATLRQALLAWGLLSFCAPWWTHAQMMMPELACGIFFLAWLCSRYAVLPSHSSWVWLAVLPWLSVRTYPWALFMAGLELWQRYRQARLRAALPLLAVVISICLALLLNLYQFGALSPAESYTQRELSAAELIKPWMAVKYGLGLMIDQEYGWLPYTPVYGLAFLGLVALWQRDRPWFWTSSLCAGAYLAPVVSFPWWWSAMAPNRYLICLAPLFALWSMESWRAWGSRPAFKALAALSWAWALCLTVLPWFCWSKQTGENWPLKLLGRALKTDVAGYFPSFMEGVNRPWSYAWGLGLAAVLFYWVRKLGPAGVLQVKRADAKAHKRP